MIRLFYCNKKRYKTQGFEPSCFDLPAKIEGNRNEMANGNDNGGYIFRPYITLKDGTVLWAKQFGKKAWRIPVKGSKPPKNDPDAKN